MYRFLLKNIDLKKEIRLNNLDIIHQLKNVLRMKIWDEIILFDWKNNNDYLYKISNIDNKIIYLTHRDTIQKHTELNLNLYQAIPNKFHKIDYLIQKATEVWFKEIIFFKSKRSQKLNITDNKKIRFQKIIEEATEQSNKNVVPKITYLEDLKWDFSDKNNILLHTEKLKESIDLSDLKIDIDKKINIFIWSEWWFTKEEIELFNSLNFIKIYLWEWILRTETAWVVVWFFIYQKFFKHF